MRQNCDCPFCRVGRLRRIILEALSKKTTEDLDKELDHIMSQQRELDEKAD